MPYKKHGEIVFPQLETRNAKNQEPQRTINEGLWKIGAMHLLSLVVCAHGRISDPIGTYHFLGKMGVGVGWGGILTYRLR